MKPLQQCHCTHQIALPLLYTTSTDLFKTTIQWNCSSNATALVKSLYHCCTLRLRNDICQIAVLKDILCFRMVHDIYHFVNHRSLYLLHRVKRGRFFQVVFMIQHRFFHCPVSVLLASGNDLSEQSLCCNCWSMNQPLFHYHLSIK